MPEEQYIPLSDLAQGTPYSQEYLSLLARKGKIPAQKNGRSWCSTREAVENYVKEQAQFYGNANYTNSDDGLIANTTGGGVMPAVTTRAGMRSKTILLALGCVVLAILTLWVLKEYFSATSTIVLPSEQKQPDYSIRVDENTSPPAVYVMPSE